MHPFLHLPNTQSCRHEVQKSLWNELRLLFNTFDERARRSLPSHKMLLRGYQGPRNEQKVMEKYTSRVRSTRVQEMSKKWWKGVLLESVGTRVLKMSKMWRKVLQRVTFNKCYKRLRSITKSYKVLHKHTVRNPHLMSKNSTLISRENCRFFMVKNSWKCCGFGLFSCWQFWFHEKNCQKK